MARRGSKPVLEHVRVLETGDGRISKFSGDGAAIQDLMRARYVSKDKLQNHAISLGGIEQVGFAI